MAGKDVPVLCTTDTLYEYRGKLKAALRCMQGLDKMHQASMYCRELTQEGRIARGLRNPGDGYEEHEEGKKWPEIADSELIQQIVLIESVVITVFAEAFECRVLPVGVYKFTMANYGRLLTKAGIQGLAKRIWVAYQGLTGGSEKEMNHRVKRWDCVKRDAEIPVKLGLYLCDSFAGEVEVVNLIRAVRDLGMRADE